MIDLVPNNTKRVEVVITSPDSGGTAVFAEGLLLTLRVAASATATEALGSLSYTMFAYVNARKGYYADILGSHLQTALDDGDIAVNQKVAIQVLEGQVLQGYQLAVVRKTRLL